MWQFVELVLLVAVIVIIIVAERSTARDQNDLREEVERLNQRIDRIPGTPIRLPVHVRPYTRPPLGPPTVVGDAATEVIPVTGRHRREVTGDAPVVDVDA